MVHHPFNCDAVLMIAFGGPEKAQDVRPFLARVTRGRVPHQRLEAVARHYDLFGGKSPVNEVTRTQADALKKALFDRGVSVPVYVGMRNWHPLLEDTVLQMHRDGVERAVVQILSVFQSRSSWNDYQDALAKALAKTKARLRFSFADPPYDHPGFFQTMAANISRCLAGLEEDRRTGAHVVFTAHSLPLSDPEVKRYVRQIEWTAERVSRELEQQPNWQIAYQSRSGRPQDPWLTPDINETLEALAQKGVADVVVAPIGFVCDNIEVLYDLDTQARQTARRAGIGFCRAGTVGDDPRFIEALADLANRAAIGES